MSLREVVFLGTSSQVPTRERNHNAMFFRFDDVGILFDPGEGTQRQMLHAGVSATQITHIAITHFHGDHCLGLAGIVQRISLDLVPHPIEVIYPKSGQVYFERLRNASIFADKGKIVPKPFTAGSGPIVVSTMKAGRLVAFPLEHRVDCYGYRFEEPDSRRMLPEKLEELGIRGRSIGELQRSGEMHLGERTVRLDEVSEHKKGQIFALVMDTRPCEGAKKLAQQADLLVCESTYLESESQEAHDNYHMTAKQAALLAREADARRLALTHFSQRYANMSLFAHEARAIHDDVCIADDLVHVSMPKRT